MDGILPDVYGVRNGSAEYVSLVTPFLSATPKMGSAFIDQISSVNEKMKLIEIHRDISRKGLSYDTPHLFVRFTCSVNRSDQVTLANC